MESTQIHWQVKITATQDNMYKNMHFSIALVEHFKPIFSNNIQWTKFRQTLVCRYIFIHTLQIGYKTLS